MSRAAKPGGAFTLDQSDTMGGHRQGLTVAGERGACLAFSASPLGPVVWAQTLRHLRARMRRRAQAEASCCPHQSPSVTASPQGEAYVLSYVGRIATVFFYISHAGFANRLPLGGKVGRPQAGSDEGER